jgi:hypothetical protein
LIAVPDAALLGVLMLLFLARSVKLLPISGNCLNRKRSRRIAE